MKNLIPILPLILTNNKNNETSFQNYRKILNLVESITLIKRCASFKLFYYFFYI